jgi:N-6 DNA Methylase
VARTISTSVIGIGMFCEVVRLLVQIGKPHAGNEIYDPTVGSGGFLIQSHQSVEEQGEKSNDLALYGQDSNGTVWSIFIMNMILHDITRFTIENADTLEDPQILDHSQIRKFDRVLANPPFSQNYSRAGMKFTSRFREWCPETGKKADLMFVQHMLASPHTAPSDGSWQPSVLIQWDSKAPREICDVIVYFARRYFSGILKRFLCTVARL